MAWSMFSAIPSSKAMAKAVFLWSPVIMIEVMPAFFAKRIEGFTSVRGGSIIPTSPIRIKFFSISEASMTISTGLYAAPSVRSASPEKLSVIRLNCFLCSSVMGITCPSTKTCVDIFKRLSIAPFVLIVNFPFSSVSVDINLRSESKANSATRLLPAFNAFRSTPRSSPSNSNEISVGSPVPWPFSQVASEQRIMVFANFSASSVGVFFFSRSTPNSPFILKYFTTVILFCVSVPVLSEQMILTDPSVSTAGKRRIIALRFDMLVTPIDSTTATIAANPSGIAATARETDTRNISARSRP